MAVYPTIFTHQGATYPLPRPSRPINETFHTNVLTWSSDSGNEQRRKRGETKVSFDISYPALVDAAYYTLRDFFIARCGKLEAFTWVHPVTKITYTVRFDSDTLSAEPVGRNAKFGEIWKASFKLVQVL